MKQSRLVLSIISICFLLTVLSISPGNCDDYKYVVLLPFKGGGEIDTYSISLLSKKLENELGKSGVFKTVLSPLADEKRVLDLIKRDFMELPGDLTEDERDFINKLKERGPTEKIIGGEIIQKNEYLALSITMIEVTTEIARIFGPIECPCEIDDMTYVVGYYARKIAGQERGELTGDVVIDSRPRGAKVYLESDYKGKTPIELNGLDIKKHDLRLELDEFRSHRRKIGVIPGRDTTYAYHLKRKGRLFSYGIRGYLGEHEFSDEDTKYGFDLRTSRGVGFFLLYHFLKNLAIQPEIIYSGAGFKTYLVYIDSGDPSGTDFEANIRYTNVDVLAVLSTSYNKLWRIKYFVGPYFGIYQYGTAKVIDSAGAMEEYRFDVESDLGVIFGIGLDYGGFGTGKMLFSFEARMIVGSKSPMEGAAPVFGGSTRMPPLVEYVRTGYWFSIGIGL